MAGVNLSIIWAELLLKGKMPENIYCEMHLGFCGMVEPIDFAKRVKSGMMNLIDWMADFCHCDCLYY
ncbi:MAG: hypothetical protein HUK10_13645 [Bacteroides heparinolyticus]|nr:hypothetical protein [Bacteroides heparinolyticus]